MNLFEAETIARKLFEKFDLTTTRFEFDNAKRRCGQFNPGKNLIRLSAPITRLSEVEQVTGTILHEIAHAIAYRRHGYGCGHGPKWKAICREIGIPPLRCRTLEPEARPASKWSLICVRCAEIFPRYKRPETGRTYTHKTCGGAAEATTTECAVALAASIKANRGGARVNA